MNLIDRLESRKLFNSTQTFTIPPGTLTDYAADAVFQQYNGTAPLIVVKIAVNVGVHELGAFAVSGQNLSVQRTWDSAIALSNIPNIGSLTGSSSDNVDSAVKVDQTITFTPMSDSPTTGWTGTGQIHLSFTATSRVHQDISGSNVSYTSSWLTTVGGTVSVEFVTGPSAAVPAHKLNRGHFRVVDVLS